MGAFFLQTQVTRPLHFYSERHGRILHSLRCLWLYFIKRKKGRRKVHPPGQNRRAVCTLPRARDHRDKGCTRPPQRSPSGPREEPLEQGEVTDLAGFGGEA